MFSAFFFSSFYFDVLYCFVRTLFILVARNNAIVIHKIQQTFDIANCLRLTGAEKNNIRLISHRQTANTNISATKRLGRICILN